MTPPCDIAIEPSAALHLLWKRFFMISCPTITKREIQYHYDWSTAFYRLLWGPHIHHGLWHAEESPAVAQRQLIEAMAARLVLKPNQRVVDVGCGMGGSSVHLARHYGCRVTGITLSPVQRMWAATGARMSGCAGSTEFLRADAEQIDFPAESFDVVWSIECTEHLFDKPAFFRKAGRWLKPGGQIAICAWLAGDEPLSDPARQQVFDVCEGFLCPSLATQADYLQWFGEAGLIEPTFVDWTDSVLQTWEICQRRVMRTGVRRLARVINRGLTLFLDRFDAILAAYRTGAMRYGCFTARMPDPKPGDCNGSALAGHQASGSAQGESRT
ncbi:MAG TPA: class I SAM-dependent methyltransferase [Pirellulales bacterium]|nr:class I SAM-dependent methyltransferase [Pirellulales bacterium]